MPATKITSRERPLSAPMLYLPTKGQSYFAERGQALCWEGHSGNIIQNCSIHILHLVFKYREHTQKSELKIGGNALVQKIQKYGKFGSLFHGTEKANSVNSWVVKSNKFIQQIILKFLTSLHKQILEQTVKGHGSVSW